MKTTISDCRLQIADCRLRLPSGHSAAGFLSRCGLLLFVFCLLLLPAGAQEQININTAPAAELMRLPGVGPTLAARIVEHRRKHGAFRRPQEIIIVHRMSAKLYRRIAHLIRV